MAYIYRVSHTVINVEGIDCVKESDGRYYPTMPELTNNSLFPAAVDYFLEIEENRFLAEWALDVDSLLKKLNIDYVKN